MNHASASLPKRLEKRIAGVTNGFIETYNGDEYEAAAYDEIDRVECG
ncbi:hypothetical protein [Streptomyces camelliae]|uniref:Uncharacterized protein n=1 Tax=Streptomyces camelliae TaxID=3004093 RepID=A0ABY7NUK9_9ACTN|nr:hypothetical protein [Streptomyces sp. HUAS 2-6]WBO61867.1 hypothetical protein O1G22_02920 [Streptomyces sp. HUAS 2-6]